jgi:hypothetical protein
MKSDPLETFVRSRRDAFDTLEPNDLWPDIEARLDAPKMRRTIPLWLKMSGIAAIFISGYFFSLLVHHGSTSTKPAVADVQALQMLTEARAYYTQQIDETSQLVFQLAADQPALTLELKNEFNEMDLLYAALEKDLGDQVATEKVVEAMIQHYRVKLEMLEDILNQLKAAEGEKKEVHHVL